MTTMPNIAISIMPANTPTESAKRPAAIIAPPTPDPPISISVTMVVIMPTGRAICRPVRMEGAASGKMISRSNWFSLAPSERADHNGHLSIWLVPE